ncbi:MAG: hypothetical protein KatS3mg101_0371 [Patescibacteria group bacterium]|nr:MAG: hypothetical protein KatS3mg101_0371 [Patescibacteria group bacterium]
MIQNPSVFKKKWFPFSLVFFISFLLYLADLPDNYSRSLQRHNHRRLISTQDAFPSTFIPYTLLKQGTFSLEGARTAFELTQDRIKIPFYVSVVDGKYYSKYPVFMGLISTPIYTLPIVLNKVPNITSYDNVLKIFVLGRISAAFYSSLSVALFYLILTKLREFYKKEKHEEVWIILFTVFYAFGTTTYSISSRALWQHTGAQFLISIIILFILNGLSNTKYIKWVGLFTGLAVLCRPTTVILAAVLTIYVFLYYRKEFLKFLVLATPAAVFLFSYNHIVFGGILREGYQSVGDTKFTGNILDGIVGLLFTPTHGVLFISPPLLLSIHSIIKTIRLKRVTPGNSVDNFNILKRFLTVILLLHMVVVSLWWCWWGLDSFGYRMLTEYIPIIGLFSYETFRSLGKWFKYIILLLIIFSIYTNLNSVVSFISRCETFHFWSFECISPQKDTLMLIQSIFVRRE